MSGQEGFRATDWLPPMSGPCFAKEDIDDLGLPLCVTIWERLNRPGEIVEVRDFGRGRPSLGALLRRVKELLAA